MLDANSTIVTRVRPTAVFYIVEYIHTSYYVRTWYRFLNSAGLAFDFIVIDF